MNNNGWQLIDTAPRDGEVCILSDGKDVSQGEFDSWERGFVRHDTAKDSDGPGAYYEIWDPTHWQPLPKPPTDET